MLVKVNVKTVAQLQTPSGMMTVLFSAEIIARRQPNVVGRAILRETFFAGDIFLVWEDSVKEPVPYSSKEIHHINITV